MIFERLAKAMENEKTYVGLSVMVLVRMREEKASELVEKKEIAIIFCLTYTSDSINKHKVLDSFPSF